MEDVVCIPAFCLSFLTEKNIRSVFDKIGLNSSNMKYMFMTLSVVIFALSSRQNVKGYQVALKYVNYPIPSNCVKKKRCHPDYIIILELPKFVSFHFRFQKHKLIEKICVISSCGVRPDLFFVFLVLENAYPIFPNMEVYS